MYEIIDNKIYTAITYDYRPGGRGDEIKTTTLKLCFDKNHLYLLRDIISDCDIHKYKNILNNIIPLLDPFQKGVIGRNFVYFTEIRCAAILGRLLKINEDFY
jgi:hypothetical protein